MARSLGHSLEGGPCRPDSPDLRIGVPRRTHTMYPDVPVVYGPVEFDPRDPGRCAVVTPRWVVEVVSPSTEACDRGWKFQGYPLLDALQEYVRVSQDAPRIESDFRQADGTGSLSYADGIGATLRLRSLDVDLPLPKAHAEFTFPPADEGEVPGPPS